MEPLVLERDGARLEVSTDREGVLVAARVRLFGQDHRLTRPVSLEDARRLHEWLGRALSPSEAT